MSVLSRFRRRHMRKRCHDIRMVLNLAKHVVEGCIVASNQAHWPLSENPAGDRILTSVRKLPRRNAYQRPCQIEILKDPATIDCVLLSTDRTSAIAVQSSRSGL